MDSIDFLSPFYGQPHTLETLVNGVEAVLAAHGLTVRALPFYCDVHPSEWLAEASSSSQRQITRVREGDGVNLYSWVLPTERGNGRMDPSERLFFICDHSNYRNIRVLLTLEPPWFFEQLRRLVEKSYPKALTTFITHRRLRRLLESFRSLHSLSKLTIKRASFRIRFEEPSQGNSKHVVPMVSWPNMELDEAFDWVHEQNGWFQSLQFDACQDHRVLASVSFSRQGVTRATRLFPQVFAGFVEPVCKTIDENVHFFGQRSRRERVDLSARPLVIQLEPNEIAESQERNRFIQAMRRLRSASVSVLHGNPYVHLSVLDYYDGSAFDIWVLSGHEITIVPQMKGTVPAIKRLIHHIFDSYAEGHLTEYQGGQS